MEVKQLTTEQIIEIYNNNFDSNFSNDQLDIEISSYGTIEVHKRDIHDDMILTISDKGAIYLYCLDNGEIYHDCLGAIKTLKKLKVKPFC